MQPSEFADFYSAHSRRLLAFFARRTFDVEVARDLTAETFAQAFEHRRRFRGSSEAEAAALAASFAGWFEGGEESAPGRALRPEDDAPGWVREEGGRLIAEKAGVGLYVSRFETNQGTVLNFALDEAVGVGNTVDGWRETFEDKAAMVLGPTAFGNRDFLDGRGRIPLLGVTARSVERLVLHYADGPPLVETGVDGGFVLLVDAWRPLRELVAYDPAGRELERLDVRYLDLRYYCDKEPGCP